MGFENKTGLQLRSLIKKSGELELSLVKVPIPEPAADEVVVRVEATPINPSDLGLLLGAADVKTAKLSGTGDAPVVTATVPESAMKAMAGRLDESMPVGNEGAGVVVKAGASDAAQTLLGKTVAMIGGAIAHGRLVTTKQLPFRLWKFGPRRNGHVDIEFSEELTADWLKSTSDLIYREKQKVLGCFAARGYQGLQ